MSFDIISYLLGKANQDAPYQPVYDGYEYETGEWVPSEDAYRGSIPFVNTHTKRPTIALVYMNESEYDDTLNVNFGSAFIGVEDFTNPLIANADASCYALNFPISRTSNASGLSTTGGKIITNALSATYEDVTADYQDFYTTKDGITPYTGATTRFWKANKHYKWVAIWM